MASVYCGKCEIEHPRPVGRNCVLMELIAGEDITEFEQSGIKETDTMDDSMNSDNVNVKLNKVISILTRVDSKQKDMDERLCNLETGTFSHSSPKGMRADQSRIEKPAEHFISDGIVPIMETLRSSAEIQRQVSARIRDLQSSSYSYSQ